MRLLRSVALLSFAIGAIVGCSANNQQGNPFKLPSGHVIRVIGIGPLNYTNGNAPSLMFQYQTDLKISEKDALRKEVDEIWSVLKIDAERGSFTSAIVSAHEVPHGIILKKSQGYNFVYQKNSDGAWYSLDDQPVGSTKP